MTEPTRVSAHLAAPRPLGASVLALDFTLADRDVTFLPGQYLAKVPGVSGNDF